MSQLGALPFPRGSTNTTGAGSGGTTDQANLEGREYWVEDDQYGTGVMVKLRIVRNLSAGALSPKRGVTFKSGTEWQVDGYNDVDGERAYIVDDYYASVNSVSPTIAVNDLFYVVIEGPCLCSTSLAGSARNNIAVGDILGAQTAATSGATTAGRVGTADFSGATTPLATQIINRIGRALSAKTTANTASDILVGVGQW